MDDVDTVVRVDGLTMAYGAREVLHGLSFDIRRGEVIALLGPNGAGKTTTVEILEGFRARSSGTVEVLGIDPQAADAQWRSRVGMVLQSWRDHSRWRVAELVDYFGCFFAPYSTGGVARPQRTAEVLAQVGLTGCERAKVSTLSGGQRRRLDVAIGIVGRPELLFLDEPTAGFDPQARRDFHDLIHQLTDFDNATVLLTTHDLAEAEKLADRILILDQGRIVASGTPDQLAAQVAGKSEVRWSSDGQRHVHSTTDATAFVRDLLETDPAAHSLEVRHTSLEDTYLAMVARGTAPPRVSNGEQRVSTIDTGVES